ncbi:MAG TPA: nuclear transport factor 2 family protein, partial [Candidatus Acidoferrum sp.]|nr:nuclear transport factor 2 family protein [Candidatus Acidoferrum sp.]
MGLTGALGFVSASVAADDSAQLRQVAAKVEAAEAVRAIKRLHNSYSHYVSDGLWNDLGDLFADDAVARFGTTTLNGKPAIRDWFMQQAGRKQLGLAAGQLNLHLALQPIINLDANGKSAKGTWHEVTLLGHYKQDANWQGGIFENEYKLDHGVWKISEMDFYQQYQGAYDDYGHKAPGNWAIPYHFNSAHLGVTVPAAAIKTLAANAGDAKPQDLAARVQRLADETAVQNLQHSFGYYLDRHLWDDVADLFTANGTLELDQRGVYQGGAHIKAALAAFYGADKLQYGELFDHINLSTVVTVAPDGMTAGARTAVLDQLGKNGEYARWEQGTLENSFVKEGGVWKLVAVHYYPRFITDYDLGWAADAKPAPAASAAPAPDAKPTQRYAAYPDNYVVALHYVNPVTGKAVQYPQGNKVKVAAVAAGKPKAATASVDLALLDKQADAAIAVD